MTDKLADGYYRADDGEASCILYVHDGVIGDDKVEWYLERDFEFSPVVVLTKDEHDALLERIAELEALVEEAGEAVPDGYYRGTDAQQLNYDVKGRQITADYQDLIVSNITLPPGWQLRRRKGEVAQRPQD